MLSIVIPYYNESASLCSVFQRLRAVLKNTGIQDYEILVVDNGSDASHHKALVDLLKDNRESVLVLSRNFGYQGALWAGLDHAKGDPVVFMDADGEDPPEVIPLFWQKWKEGYDVVYGVRTSRMVYFHLNLCYKIFYRLLARWSDIKIPLDAGEFSLVSGKALQALRTFNDRTRMLRILRAWVGFRQIGVPYARERRYSGKSKFTMGSSIAFAWEGFVAGTDLPVRVSLYCALICIGFCAAGSVYYLFWYFYGNERIPGFASLNITLFFLFSMVFLTIHVLSRFLMKMFAEIRLRPPYIISNRFTASAAALGENEMPLEFELPDSKAKVIKDPRPTFF